MPKRAAPPICPHCEKPSELVGGQAMYPHRQDLFDRWFYRCVPCGAYVGCHKGTKRALGTPANAETRGLRHDAHIAFDRLWKRKAAKEGITLHEARSAGYAWLAQQLDVPAEQMHIGMSDAARCRAIIVLCERKPARAN